MTTQNELIISQTDIYPKKSLNLLKVSLNNILRITQAHYFGQDKEDTAG